MMKIGRYIVAGAALCVALPAVAATTVDFDQLPAGGAVADRTAITNQYLPLGVTFSAIATGGDVVAPVATSYAAGPAGPNYAGNYLVNAPDAAPFIFNPGFALTPRYDTIRIDFTGTANAVSLSLNNFSNIGQTLFNAYDVRGTLLETFAFRANEGWTRVALTSGGIARLDLVTNVYNGSNTAFGIDQLTFDLAAVSPVPEPASWIMMLMGFGMIGATVRYRRRNARVRYA